MGWTPRLSASPGEFVRIECFKTDLVITDIDCPKYPDVGVLPNNVASKRVERVAAALFSLSLGIIRKSQESIEEKINSIETDNESKWLRKMGE